MSFSLNKSTSYLSLCSTELFLLAVLGFHCGAQARLVAACSSPARDPTHVPCIGRQVLNHWTTREAPLLNSCAVLCLVAQSCQTLCDPMDCSPPGSSVHGILQAKILEWVAISYSRGSSRPTDRTRVSCITARFFFYHLSLQGSL